MHNFIFNFCWKVHIFYTLFNRWHAAVRFEHALQAARDLGTGSVTDEAVRGLERAKWRLWHGRWPGCRRRLAALCRWMQRKHVRDMVGIGRFQRHVSDLLSYLERNQDALVHYAARHRRGEPISTAFIESAVNEIVAKRMNKKQQMRWNRTTVQPFLDVRIVVVNDTLEDATAGVIAASALPMTKGQPQRPRNEPHGFACSLIQAAGDRADVCVAQAPSCNMGVGQYGLQWPAFITKETVKGAPSPNARRLNMTVNKELFVSIVGDVAPGWPSP
jgi:hypothetical protein